MSTFLRFRGDFFQVLIVRNDLKMGKGKIAAQCGYERDNLSSHVSADVWRLSEPLKASFTDTKCASDDAAGMRR